MKTNKPFTITLNHYARRERRVIQFASREDRAEFYSLPKEVRDRVDDLQHAFAFVAACDSEFDGIAGVCYGQRGWSLKKITALYQQWVAAKEDWRVLAKGAQKLW
jgi:hypothetical protein